MLPLLQGDQDGYLRELDASAILAIHGESSGHDMKTPSTDTTSGVNEAHSAAASLYFLFFSSSANNRIEATSRCKYSDIYIKQCNRLKLPYQDP